MSQESVKVVIRVRPLNSSEISRKNSNIIEVDKELNQLSILDPKLISKPFAFDAIYDETYTQQQIYDETAFPLVESVLKGYNGTIFAYGQTGCGKTFTMVGVPGNEQLQGIIPNSFSHIFGCIAESGSSKCFLVRCSYTEIYNEEIRDLISNDTNLKLELKESADKGIYVKNLSMHPVKSVQDIEKLMEYGNKHRITKETNMNERSSRSHAIFTINVETSEEVDGRTLVKAGKLNLVDLAGSERQKKTGAEGERLKEGIKINLSLHALGNVITSLVDGSSHIPYRDSKLTMLLQDSLGGNTKTVMIAVISPADYNYEESLSTLRYASRAKFIKNKPKVNEDPKDALLRSYAEEIQRLKKLLMEHQSGEPVEKIIEIEKPAKTKELALISTENGAEGQYDQPARKYSSEPSGQSEESDGERSNTNEKDSDLDKTCNEQNPEEIISDLQKQLIIGGEAINKSEQEKLRAIRQYRLKLKKQKKKEKQLIEEHRKIEEEMVLKEKNYRSMQEELEDLRKVVKRLRSIYAASLSEISDLTHEHETEKQEFLEEIREKEKENELLHKIFENLMPAKELRTIKSKSTYDEINHKWKVPSFILQQKQLLFPKLPQAQLRELVEEKYIAFDNDTKNHLRNESADHAKRHTSVKDSRNLKHNLKIQDEDTKNSKNFSTMPLIPIEMKQLSSRLPSIGDPKEEPNLLRKNKFTKQLLQPIQNHARKLAELELKKSAIGII
ncbi:unnamed protein product [Blepharisma stoltei]|uniref:Kinesin-like protein n=1 Tax=Blepharisma stoltei TaxID=1481888 RepID=A0AAU9J063_9CILI|nr:unnamed protein product [Blepharisma stoltei]